MNIERSLTTFVQRAAFWLLALVVLSYTADLRALAEEEGPVTNVRVSKQGRINVFIEYDLLGDPDDLYTVSLRVKLASDTSFTYTPVNIIGDIGANVRPGKNRRISWRTSDEYIPALDREDVQFVVTAISMRPPGPGAELYIAGGAGVLGLALAIILLSSNKAEQEPVRSFPLPPGRPR
ncbi:MAG TPA: hypothetical protein VNL69_00875 [Bacteroidota bacterium]|nr:hypothetical protein [Bacteroidota bacterium]